MITRRSLLLGGAAVSAALGLAACSSTSQPEPGASRLGDVTVGLTYIPNVQFSAFYVGVDRGIFADLGVGVTLRHHGQQEDVFGALLGGQEGIVFASADEAMVAAAGGQELLTFATSYQRYPAEVMGVGPHELPEVPLRVLADATLGIPGHFGSSYYAALCALHEAGLSEAEVKLQDIGYTQLSALEAGQVDFIVGFRNNELVQLQAKGNEVTSLPVSDPDAPRLVGPSLVTRGESISTEVLRAVAEGMRQAEQAVIDDPDAALEATARQVPALADPAQRESAERVLKATAELWQRDGVVEVGIDEAAFARMGEFLTEAGIVEAAPERAYLKL